MKNILFFTFVFHFFLLYQFLIRHLFINYRGASIDILPGSDFLEGIKFETFKEKHKLNIQKKKLKRSKKTHTQLCCFSFYRLTEWVTEMKLCNARCCNSSFFVDWKKRGTQKQKYSSAETVCVVRLPGWNLPL